MTGPGGDWNKDSWHPTQRWPVDELQCSGDGEFAKLQADIKRLTVDRIQCLPYNAGFWFCRGEAFVKLGYPDLALGDLQKARILVVEAQRHDSPLGAAAFIHYGIFALWSLLQVASPGIKERLRDFWVTIVYDYLKALEKEILRELILALTFIEAHPGILQIAKEGQQKFPDEENFGKVIERTKERLLNQDGRNNPTFDPRIHYAPDVSIRGIIRRRAYPWMANDNLLLRNDAILREIQEDFWNPFLTCEAGLSPFLASQVPEEAKEITCRNNLYGVLAARDISEQEIVLIEDTYAHATAAPDPCPFCAKPLPSTNNDRTFAPCCNSAFCNPTCMARAQTKFHKALCGRDFSFLHAAAQAIRGKVDVVPLEPLLLLRVLATAIQENVEHPLKSRVIRRFTANYSSGSLFAFSFKDHIVNPIRLLQVLGIDPFANANYDTWVLEAIRHRLNNNRLGVDLDGGYGLITVHGRYSMLNHSCEPNVGVDGELGTGSEISVVAMRDIKKGEELCVSYIGDVWGRDREQRQQSLKVWLGGECKCARCERERVM